MCGQGQQETYLPKRRRNQHQGQKWLARRLAALAARKRGGFHPGAYRGGQRVLGGVALGVAGFLAGALIGTAIEEHYVRLLKDMALHIVFRATAMISAAEELTASGGRPAWYPAVCLWSGAMYAIYMTLAILRRQPAAVPY